MCCVVHAAPRVHSCCLVPQLHIRRRRGVEYTGRCRAAMWSTHVHTRYVSHRSCSHVHKECACPYMARRRSVATGESCSHMHKECAHTFQGSAWRDGVLKMPASNSNYSASWRRFTPRWLGPNIVSEGGEMEEKFEIFGLLVKLRPKGGGALCYAPPA